jgi:hypothetical protein
MLKMNKFFRCKDVFKVPNQFTLNNQRQVYPGRNDLIKWVLSKWSIGQRKNIELFKGVVLE